MKYVSFILLFVILATVVHAKEYGNILDVEYVRIYDGDTVYVNIVGMPDIFGKELPIRLKGVDTPEIRGKCNREKTMAKQAKDFVATMLIEAQTIDLLNVERGKYFRVVADLYADGKSVSQALLDANLAVVYDGGKKQQVWCS